MFAIKFPARGRVHLLVLLLTSTWATAATEIGGRVINARELPLPGVLVRLAEVNASAVTDQRGQFYISGSFSGELTLVVTYFGTELARVQAKAGDRDVLVRLDQDPRINASLVVNTSRTGADRDIVLSEQTIRWLPAPVTGELLRVVPGVDSARRGPTGLDPVVRGLRETQVGQYIDGTRIFPAGPARMDSALSHVDPRMIEKIRVVKGPYALAQGAGNLSAIHVETFSLDTIGENALQGSFMAGYQSNTEATDGTASLFGAAGKWGYWFQGVARSSADYESGSGEEIQADMDTREIRGKVQYNLDEISKITLTLGAQDQEDIDYPGRLLDAEFFETFTYSVRYNRLPVDNRPGIEAHVYHTAVDHGMNNNNKPTAQPNPDRVPPFPLRVLVDTESLVTGGRFALTWLPGSWEVETGADFYLSEKDATRTIERRDMERLLFVDKMWPDAEVQDTGLFARVARSSGSGFTGEATVRMDFVSAEANEISEFFRENVSGDTDGDETNLSAAFVVGHQLSTRWNLSLGAGTAVRTADATERFSDRIPTARAQFSAEFVGNPQLDPERANQADLWLEGTYRHLNLNLNLFYRRVEDYITIQGTDLPKRLPLSPPVVYQYVNGEAEFQGGELTLDAELRPHWRLRFATAYLEGDDLDRDEPAFGVAPWRSDLGLRFESPGRQWYGEASLAWVDSQDEVAVSRNEATTDSYTTVDLVTGYRYADALVFQLGVANLTDEDYINHLNARNPFTGQPIPEPGRTAHFTVRYAF